MIEGNFDNAYRREATDSPEKLETALHRLQRSPRSFQQRSPKYTAFARKRRICARHGSCHFQAGLERAIEAVLQTPCRWCEELRARQKFVGSVNQFTHKMEKLS
jgi:hypothetical protein